METYDKKGDGTMKSEVCILRKLLMEELEATNHYEEALCEVTSSDIDTFSAGLEQKGSND